MRWYGKGQSPWKSCLFCLESLPLFSTLVSMNFWTGYRLSLSSSRNQSVIARFLPSLFLAAMYCVADANAAVSTAESQQFGARRVVFEVGEGRGFVVFPAKPALDGSKPWVWYAPTFIGQHPDDSHTWMATQMLGSGFAICGVEVGESYGSPKGRARYSDFYNIVTTQFGLDKKACLLAQRRGGLMLLNWASENAQRVQCIAGIYTVCSIESYPGADKAAGAYEMDAETLRAKLTEHNPIERVRPLADAKVPMLFIHGDSDSVVPSEKNAGEYVSRCKQSGGTASIIVVPGKGHEVCPEFFQSQPFTDFILSKGAKRPAL